MENLFSLIVTYTFSNDKLRDYFRDKLSSKGAEQLNESTYSLPFRAEFINETCESLTKDLTDFMKENKIKKEESDFVDLYCAAHLCDIPNSNDKIYRWKVL